MSAVCIIRWSFLYHDGGSKSKPCGEKLWLKHIKTAGMQGCFVDVRKSVAQSIRWLLVCPSATGTRLLRQTECVMPALSDKMLKQKHPIFLLESSPYELVRPPIPDAPRGPCGPCVTCLPTLAASFGCSLSLHRHR